MTTMSANEQLGQLCGVQASSPGKPAFEQATRQLAHSGGACSGASAEVLKPVPWSGSTSVHHHLPRDKLVQECLRTWPNQDGGQHPGKGVPGHVGVGRLALTTWS